MNDVKEHSELFLPEDHPPAVVTFGLGLQHVLAMFGATVLAPILMGFNPNTAIFLSGIATIIFIVITNFKVPSYLGSSFAFIAAVGIASGYSGSGPNPNLDVALGGIFIAGLIYAIVAGLVIFVGPRFIERLLPDLVSGTIVAIIGISLAGVAISQIGSTGVGLASAFTTLLVVVLWSVYAPGRLVSPQRGKKSILRIIEVIPILIGGVVGYAFYFVCANIFGLADPVNTAAIQEADLIGLPEFTTPTFTVGAAITIAPVVIVLLAENLGHVKAIGAMMGRNLDDKIGKTFLGDAVGTMGSSALGGPGLTTYAENMAVMRFSNNFSSITFIAAGLIAIALGFSPKFGAIILSIPLPVIGGLSLAMFGLITAAAGSIWQRGIKSGEINFLESRTLIVAGIGLVAGAGNLTFKVAGAEINGIVTATLITIALHWLLHIGKEKVSIPVEYE
ncbi:solute carrier family 23 protein [Erythrobacter sp. F6033]|uniref:solute carrier family 23 protein n=1 Tax=Erythrobacter sp. F6033 TaxID=2926401 RepID=UPI001FF0E30F|nr:solute carrier family 23 protein [Erythrobacter sp. F6033]MCK0127441.1 hypothetical protein [Erythrobacter sp. F6033]